MKKCCSTLSRVAIALLVVSFPSDGSAQTTEEQLVGAPPILRVEEDWELLIADPDPSADAPQIVTVFGPTNANFGTHTVFEMNHGTLPSFGEGGMQMQVWWGDYLVGYRTQHSPVELASCCEVITYTTVTELEASEDKLRLSVINGNSTTWGSFGNSEPLKITLITFRDDLNPYDPENSLVNSRVTFGANRVNRFCRKAIRFYIANGLFLEDTEVRYVHRLAADIPPFLEE